LVCNALIMAVMPINCMNSRRFVGLIKCLLFWGLWGFEKLVASYRC
jgi:hypothetical protein